MHTKPRTILSIGLLSVLPFLLSGCYLQLLFAYIGQENEFGEVSIGGSSESIKSCDNAFDFESERWYVECTYVLVDQEGFLQTITTTTGLVDTFGFYGLFIDPLIVQVPENAVNFGGDMNKGAGPQEFVVSETDAFDVTPSLRVAAEPGHKFIIVEFPPNLVEELETNGTLAGDYLFDFGFRLPSVQAFDVKPMLTVKIVDQGKSYFVPMLPCVTNMAQAPAFTIEPAGSASNLMGEIQAAVRQNPALACDNAVYDFGTAAGDGFMLYLPLLHTQP